MFKSVRPPTLTSRHTPFSRDTIQGGINLPCCRHHLLLFISQANRRTKGKTGYGTASERITVRVREKIDGPLESRFPLFRPIEMIKIGTNSYPPLISREQSEWGLRKDAVRSLRKLPAVIRAVRYTTSARKVDQVFRRLPLPTDSSFAHGPRSLKSTTFGVGERQLEARS